MLIVPLMSCAAAPPLPRATPPGYTLHRTGDVHDFDYFAAAGWTVTNRKLRARGVGSNDWEEFPASLCMTPYLDGTATVEEMFMPTKAVAGLTLRVFDGSTHQWSIYWASSKTGRLDPTPVVGGFQGDRGEFYADDKEGDRPIKVRFLWHKRDADHARWEQAFSYDDKTWETNWTADFVRGNESSTCDRGRPRR
jgi:hypothetical protein